MPSRNSIGYMRKLPVLLLVVVAAVTVLAACNGDDDADDGDPDATPRVVLTPIDADILPIVISSDLAIGRNRFSLGLVDQTANGAPVVGADLHFAFYLQDTEQGTLKLETDAESIVIQQSFTHLHEDGELHLHEGGETGAYVAYPEFDTAGTWGVEVTGTTPDGTEIEPVRPTFSVNEEPFGLAVGDPAPPIEQTLLADVDDIAEIDTSQVPIPEQHGMTITEAVTSGRPTAIAVTTPAFCTSQICGPIKELFDELYADYSDRANFIHVEPYDVACVREGDFETLFDCRNPIIDEWGLRSEPWIFIVDADGNIAAMFDGVAGLEEMQAAMDEVLS